MVQHFLPSQLRALLAHTRNGFPSKRNPLLPVYCTRNISDFLCLLQFKGSIDGKVYYLLYSNKSYLLESLSFALMRSLRKFPNNSVMTRRFPRRKRMTCKHSYIFVFAPFLGYSRGRRTLLITSQPHSPSSTSTPFSF